MKLDDGYVPLEHFGEDHWSQIGYMDSVIVECAGFQVGYDPRMRQGRRHTRVMSEQCRRPKRPTNPAMGMVMEDRYSTRLKSGDQVSGHDDWHCVQDMIAAGLMGIINPEVSGGVESDADKMEPGVILTFTKQGWDVAHQLRQHKANGGRWRNFEYQLVTA